MEVGGATLGALITSKLLREGGLEPTGLGGRLFSTVLSRGAVLGTPKSGGGEEGEGEGERRGGEGRGEEGRGRGRGRGKEGGGVT